MNANPQTSKKITIFTVPTPSFTKAQNKRSSNKNASMSNLLANEIIMLDYNQLLVNRIVILINLIKR